MKNQVLKSHFLGNETFLFFYLLPVLIKALKETKDTEGVEKVCNSDYPKEMFPKRLNENRCWRDKRGKDSHNFQNSFDVLLL